TVGNLARHNDIQCDIAVTIFSVGDNPEKYVSDVASLHIVKKTPAVFAVINENANHEIYKHKKKITTNDIIYLPVDPADFARMIKTYIVALSIQRNKKPAGIGFKAGAKSLGEILTHHNIISPLQLKKALDYQQNTNQRLGDALVELGYIDDDQKMNFLASQLGVPLAISKQYATVDLDTVALIPDYIAKRHNCVALERNDNELSVAMIDVLDLRLLDSLRDITEMTIKPVLGKLDDIVTTVERNYRDIASHQEATDLMPDIDESVEYLQDTEEDINLDEIAAAGAELGIVRLVNMLIGNAVKDKASDIHIEPLEKELYVRFRIDGDLRKIMSPPKRTHQAIVTRIKILSNLDIAERRLPQDGRMVVKMGRREVDIRVSVLPTIFGEKVVLRVLDKEAFEKSVKNLGFTQFDLNIFKQQIEKPYGMIIVTGPTGSGKSTTLYSALQQVKNVTRNIVTIEDPVEFHMEGIAQVHVNTKIGLTFANTLRSILRQDPDIILIGEIRDNETADIAIKMALTGHLVFSTLHTNDAASAIARFVDIGIPPLLLGSSLNLVVAQRLVRKVCPKCKVEYDPPEELIDQLSLDKKDNFKFYVGEGCVNCNGTGYSGRVGIFEMIVISKEIRKMILR
ncbi:MAG: Flp pilus assembly complex ATPase component, partial [bacterium]|nr:Flp pilus assembly complex ATPase component [bacterium]